jgi:hypothetical protein
MVMRRIPIIVREWMHREDSDAPLRGFGFGLSVALHGLVVLALLLMGRGSPRPSVPVHVLIAELVQEEVPALQPAAGEDAVHVSESVRPEIPKKGRPATVAAQTARPNLGALLAMVERAHRPEPVRSQLEQASGEIAADLGGGENDVARGSFGTTALKDFIRAQIERRWQVDARRLGGRDFTVVLRLALNADGSIAKLEIIEDAARKDDALYRRVAISGRDAALLSSPLRLPKGVSGDQLDFTLDLHTKDAIR